MDNQEELIRQQMEATRTSLQDKLETLEQQVKDTVQHTTEAVTETVDTVKEAVHETVNSVKSTFDLRHQVEQHPWGMMAGATLAGFFCGRLLGSVANAAHQETWSAPPSYRPPSRSYRDGGLTGMNMGQAAASLQPPPIPQRTWMDTLFDEYKEEINKIKGLAIATVAGVVREMLTDAAPAPMESQIKEVVDSVTRKLGGDPIEGSILQSWSGSSDWERHTNGKHYEEEANQPAGTSQGQQEEMPAKRFDF